MKHVQPKHIEGNQYFRIKDEKQEYWGDRYFKFNWMDEKVVQVTITGGELYKRGKKTSIGIYLIGRTTFMSDYFAFSKLDDITKEQYQEQFEKCLLILK